MGPGGSGHGAARPVLSDGILTLRSDKAIAPCGARPTVKEVEVPLPRSQGHQRWAVPVTHDLRGGHVDPSLALPLQQQHGRAQRWAGRPHTGLTQGAVRTPSRGVGPAAPRLYLSWKRRRASCAHTRTRPSTDRVSRGLSASKMPRTHLVISRGE